MMELLEIDFVMGITDHSGFRLRSCVKLFFAVLLCFGLASTRSVASDWEEESPKAPAPAMHQAPATKDTVVLDDGATPGKQTPATGRLQGSATAVRTRPVVPSASLLQAQYAERIMAVQRLDAEATRFLQTAAVNAITPPSVFRAFMQKNHPEFPLDGNDNSGEFLLVVRGQWDDSTKPLHSLGLKFQSVKTRELSASSLTKYRAVIIDCAGELPKPAFQKIRDFVSAGGYLLTTDWALQNVLEPAFPGIVQWNRDNSDGVITDAFIVDNESSLLTGLSGRRFTWKLDRMSQCVRIVDPSRVHLIARSSRLSLQDPQLRVLGDPLMAGALALEFSFGRGKVLHLVGHFDNCANSFRALLLPDPAPGAGISLRQALAANFIVEALNKKSGSMPPAENGDKKDTE